MESPTCNTLPTVLVMPDTGVDKIVFALATQAASHASSYELALAASCPCDTGSSLSSLSDASEQPESFRSISQSLSLSIPSAHWAGAGTIIKFFAALSSLLLQAASVRQKAKKSDLKF